MHRFMTRAAVASISAFAIFAASGALGQGTGSTTPATNVQPRPPSITVAKVERTEVTATTLVSGNIIARDEVLVVPEVDGLSVLEILAEEGDLVKAGQVLIRLNRAALDVSLAQNAATMSRVVATIAQARAQITEAEANKQQANNAFARAQTLRSDGITSLDTFDQRQAASRSADARLLSARQTLTIAEAERASTDAARSEIELRIQRSEIKAPRAGMISRRNARQGAIASMAAPEPLFRIIADAAVELEAEVPEADIPRLTIGKRVDVMPAGTSQAIVGQIRLISPEVDRQTRLGKVRISLPVGSAKSIGAFARGVIEIDRRNGLTVPVTAITYRRDLATVQVVEKGPADGQGQVRIRSVKLGLTGQGKIELIEGVREGDLVVARAGTFVRDGDIITPVPVTPVKTSATTTNSTTSN
ncbi:MAG: efflux RND transporter periplasmic adaptor subunit [Bosea sp. (in: a-proteobacteria)]